MCIIGGVSLAIRKRFIFTILLSIFLIGTCSAKPIVYGFWSPNSDPGSYQPDWTALTHVTYCNLAINADGTIRSPSNIDEFNKIRDTAHAHGVKFIISLACDPDSMDSLLANNGDKFSTNVVSALSHYGADGINLDIEGARDTNHITGTSNTELYESFMGTLYSRVKEINPDYHISYCCQAPPESIYRNTNLAQYTDAVFLMSYDASVWTGKTGPNAPLDKTIDHVATLREYYPSTKIILGVPFYGYDFVSANDQPGSVTTSNNQIAMKDAITGSLSKTSNLFWDSKSQTPYYTYQIGSQWHQVWYDDDKSLEIKYNYCKSRNLAGIGFWALGMEKPGTLSLFKS